MSVAGIAWGLYSLLGRDSTAPVADVTGTFIRLAPATLAVTALAWPWVHVSLRGAALAAVSGAVTSGGGYVLWYYVLRRLTATRASIVQLSVPALAALAGTLVLAEPITVRLVTSAALILGGVALSIGGRARTSSPFRPALDRGQ
jgi:drug/metabolite transporter (DMT)-like permease